MAGVDAELLLAVVVDFIAGGDLAVLDVVGEAVRLDCGASVVAVAHCEAAIPVILAAGPEPAFVLVVGLPDVLPEAFFVGEVDRRGGHRSTS
jgi:hypothetical protein